MLFSFHPVVPGSNPMRVQFFIFHFFPFSSVIRPQVHLDIIPTLHLPYRVDFFKKFILHVCLFSNWSPTSVFLLRLTFPWISWCFCRKEVLFNLTQCWEAILQFCQFLARKFEYVCCFQVIRYDSYLKIPVHQEFFILSILWFIYIDFYHTFHSAKLLLNYLDFYLCFI